ncbi:uncharacterized protein ACBT57_024184 isoform 1-T2 [Dama dama]
MTPGEASLEVFLADEDDNCVPHGTLAEDLLHPLNSLLVLRGESAQFCHQEQHVGSWGREQLPRLSLQVCVKDRTLSLDSNAGFTRMLFPVALLLVPVPPTRMILSSDPLAQ